MALHRRAVLASLTPLVAGGCVSRDGSDPTESSTPSPTTEPDYASCDSELQSGETLHSAGDIPDDLSEDSAREYAQVLERDVMLPPPEERSDGHVSIGDVRSETVTHGYLVTVEVTGGYFNEVGETPTVHYDLGAHVSTYFMNEQVVRRARDPTAELDPRDHGEVVVCEA